MKLLACLVAFPVASLSAAELTLSWSGGGLNQNWETAINWLPIGIPCNAGGDIFNAIIGGGAGAIVINDSCTLQSIDMQLGASLTLANARTLTIRDYFLNVGSMSLDSTGNPTTISISDSSGDGQVAIGGAGLITLDSANEQITGTSGNMLIHNAGHTIRGFGHVGVNAINIVNAGFIIADTPGNTLFVDPRSTFENNVGLLVAEGGGTLQLQPATYTDVNGTIRVEDGSEIILNSLTLNGGSFSKFDPNGTLSDNKVTILGGCRLNGIRNEVSLNISNGSTLTLGDGDFINNGQVLPLAVGNLTTIQVGDSGGDQIFHIGGSGEIVLDHGNDQLSGTSGHMLVHDTPHEILGGGALGLNSINVTNHSVVSATNGLVPLVIDPRSTWTNDGGLLSAVSGTLLRLQPATYSCLNGGQILTGDSAELRVTAITAVNTPFNAEDLDADPSNNLVTIAGSSTFDTCTSQCRIDVNNGQTLTLTNGDFFNGSTIHLNSTGNLTTIFVTDPADQVFTITGPGTIFLDNQGSDIVTGSSGHTLVHDATHRIEGSGSIGANSINVVNKGTIEANRNGETLTIDPRVTFVNDGGTLAATNGSTIHLSPANYSNANGGSTTIHDETTLVLSAVTLENMNLEVSNLDLDLANNLVRLVNSSTFDGVVNDANLEIINGQTLTLRDLDFTNNGPIHLESTGNPTVISMTDSSDQELTIDGPGTIFLDHGSHDQITGSSGHTFRHGPNHRIEGAGRIGLNAVNIINEGAIAANRSGETLTIDPRSTFVNDGGSLVASNGATIRLEPGVYGVANGGSYVIEDGTDFILVAVTLDNMALDVTDSDFDLSNNLVTMTNSSTFKSVVNGAEIHVVNGQTFTIRDGDFTNNGSIHLDATVNATSLSITDAIDQLLTVNGTGTIFLDSAAHGTISGSSGHTFIHGADHRIEGSGRIGVNTLNIINLGSIEADRNGETLTIYPRSAFVNDGGTVIATNGALVTFAGGVFSSTNGGLYQFEDGTTLTLSSPTLQNLSLEVIDNDADLSNNQFLVPSSTTFNGVTNGGEIRISNGQTLRLQDGDFTNNGTVNPDSTANDTTIHVNDVLDMRLSILGTGEIRLDSSSDVVAGSSGHTLVNGPGHAIRGRGRVGNNVLKVENQGLISAEVAGETLRLDNWGLPPANAGTLQAVSGGILQFQEAQTNAGGDLFAEAGSMILGLSTVRQIDGVTRVDGELQATALTLSGGRLQGIGLVDAPLTATNSLVSPGNSTGTLTVEGNAAFGTGSSLQIEINSTIDHDLLAVTSGNLNLTGGALQLLYGGGPADVLAIDTLTIATCTGVVTGEFINVGDGARLVSFDGLVSFQVNYLPSSITLTDFLYLGGAVNEAPVFSDFTLTLDVAENTAPGTLLYDFNAYDPEGVVIDYLEIPLSPFEMNEITGELTLVAPLDFETQDEWLVTIQASDGVNTTDIVVTVSVLDIADTNEEIVHELLTDPTGAFPGETDPAIIGFDADPDHDGLPNFFELWLGTDPAVSDQPTPFILDLIDISGSDHGSIEVVVDGSVEDLLVVVVEFSFDLITWRDATATRALLSTNSPFRTLRFNDIVPLSPATRFFVRFGADPDAQK